MIECTHHVHESTDEAEIEWKWDVLMLAMRRRDIGRVDGGVVFAILDSESPSSGASGLDHAALARRTGADVRKVRNSLAWLVDRGIVELFAAGCCDRSFYRVNVAVLEDEPPTRARRL